MTSDHSSHHTGTCQEQETTLLTTVLTIQEPVRNKRQLYWPQFSTHWYLSGTRDNSTDHSSQHTGTYQEQETTLLTTVLTTLEPVRNKRQLYWPQFSPHWNLSGTRDNSTDHSSHHTGTCQEQETTLLTTVLTTLVPVRNKRQLYWPQFSPHWNLSGTRDNSTDHSSHHTGTCQEQETTLLTTVLTTLVPVRNKRQLYWPQFSPHWNLSGTRDNSTDHSSHHTGTCQEQETTLLTTVLTTLEPVRNKRQLYWPQFSPHWNLSGTRDNSSDHSSHHTWTCQEQETTLLTTVLTTLVPVRNKRQLYWPQFSPHWYLSGTRDNSTDHSSHHTGTCQEQETTLLTTVLTTLEPVRNKRQLYWPQFSPHWNLSGTRDNSTDHSSHHTGTCQEQETNLLTTVLTTLEPVRNKRQLYWPQYSSHRNLSGTCQEQETTLLTTFLTTLEPVRNKRQIYWPQFSPHLNLSGTRDNSTDHSPHHTGTCQEPVRNKRQLYWPHFWPHWNLSGTRDNSSDHSSHHTGTCQEQETTLLTTVLTTLVPVRNKRQLYWPQFSPHRNLSGTIVFTWMVYK